MADTKITSLLTPQVTTNPATDVLPIVNIADTSMASSGSTRKITVNTLLGAGGTATLASATITGDLTVDTNVLKVDTTNNRVGIGTASPTSDLDIFRASGSGITSGISLRTAAGAGGDGSFIKWLAGGTSEKVAQIDGVLNGTDVGYLSFQCGNGADAMAEQYRIASSGVFTWYDGAGGTRMTLNATGLGVGAGPDTGFRLTVKSSRALARLESTTGTEDVFYQVKNTGGTFALGIDNSTGTNQTGVGYATYIWGSGAYPFIVATNNTERLRIDSAGNCGIGVTPSAWAAAVKALQIGAAGAASYDGTNYDISSNRYLASGGTSTYIANGFATMARQVSGQHLWYNAPSGTAGNAITFTQAMTLDSGGNLFISKTATGLGTVGIQASPSGWFQATVSGDASLFTNRLASDGKTVQLYRQTLEVGNISVTTTGATFNSTSDYRLKEAVAPLSGGLARVNALKPSVYKWKSNGSFGEGFLAHELAEVVPSAVNGEKDAVNEDGSINAQSIDMSRVVPILVAAIQELTARVQTLEAK